METRVKGTLVHSAVESVLSLLAEGRISRDELEARLSREALEVIDVKPTPVAWYPLRVYRELLDVFWEVGGARSPEFMFEAGRSRARALIDAGLYGSFVRAGRRRKDGSADSLLENARSAVRMTNILYESVDVDVTHDETANTIVLTYRELEGFSDAMFHATHGFLSGIATVILELPEHTVRSVWDASRPAPGVFRFARPLNPAKGR